MRKLVCFVTLVLVGGLLVSPVFAGGKVGVESKKVAVTKSVSQPKVEVAKVSLVDVVRAYFSTRLGFSIINDRSKEPGKPSEPQKGWGYRPGVAKEYIVIRDHGGDYKEI